MAVRATKGGYVHWMRPDTDDGQRSSGRGVPPDLADNRCHIAPELVDRTDQTIWFINAPYGGSLLRFRGEPTSLLYAIAPTAWQIEAGLVPGVERERIALLNPLNRSEFFYAELRARLATQEALKVVCISTMTAACVEARRIADEVKAIARKRGRDIITIFGGPHEDDVAVCTAADHRYSDLADFSVSGDGEEILAELIRAVFEVPGAPVSEVKEEVLARRSRIEECRGRGSVSFRHRDGVRRIEFKNGMLPLSDLPRMPRWLLHESDTRTFSVFKEGGWNVKTAQVMTQRGCQWRCNFCSESGGANERTVESVMAEIDDVLDFRARHPHLDRQDYRAIFFDDSTFTSRAPRRVRYLAELFAALERRGVEWGCQTRLDQIDSSLLDSMRAAGCTYVYTGLESASDEMLRAMVKDETRQAAEKAFTALRTSGIRVGVSLMFGALRTGAVRTEESDQTIETTLDFVKAEADQGNIVVVSPNLATFYPGTRITTASGSTLDFHNPVVNQGYPWSRFEEGESFHPEGVTRELAETILKGCIRRFSDYALEQDLYSIEEYHHAYRHGLVSVASCMDLNHASIAEPLEGVQTAANEIAAVEDHLNSAASERCYERTRRAAAALMGARAAQLVLTRNATEAAALAVAISGLGQGARVLTTDVENVSVRRIFRRHMDHGNTGGYDLFSSFQDYGSRGRRHPLRRPLPAETRLDVVEVLERQDLMEDLILEAVDTNTAMVVFSHVVRDTGRICNVERVCREVRKRNPRAIILVDGAQALGALPRIDVCELDCDFYIAAPHKTLAAYPLGLLCVKNPDSAHVESLQARDRDDVPLWPVLRGMFAPEWGIDPTFELSLSVPEVAGFRAAVDVLRRRNLLHGSSFEELCRHRKVLKDIATELMWPWVRSGWLCLHSLGDEHSSFIMSFRFEDLDNRALVERLWRERVFASYIARGDRIRFSFGADTTPAQIREAIEVMRVGLCAQDDGLPRSIRSSADRFPGGGDSSLSSLL